MLPENILEQLKVEALDMFRTSAKLLLSKHCDREQELSMSVAILTAYGVLHGFNAKHEYEKGKKGN